MNAEFILSAAKPEQFIKTDLGQAINGGIDIALKSLLPDFIEDEIIAVKNSLLI